MRISSDTIVLSMQVDILELRDGFEEVRETQRGDAPKPAMVVEVAMAAICLCLQYFQLGWLQRLKQVVLILKVMGEGEGLKILRLRGFVM